MSDLFGLNSTAREAFSNVGKTVAGSDEERRKQQELEAKRAKMRGGQSVSDYNAELTNYLFGTKAAPSRNSTILTTKSATPTGTTYTAPLQPVSGVSLNMSRQVKGMV